LVLRETGENKIFSLFKEHPVQANFDISDLIEKPRRVRAAISFPLLSRGSSSCENQLLLRSASESLRFEMKEPLSLPKGLGK
jgi:hypothetical protein